MRHCRRTSSGTVLVHDELAGTQRKGFCGCWKKAAIKTLGTNPAGELYYNPGQTNSLKGSVLISFDCEIVNCIERYFNVLGYF